MKSEAIARQLPFAQHGRFWRGNMHMHSTESDGAHSAEEACTAYQREGYDFVAITDHFLSRYDYPVTDTQPFNTESFVTLAGAELHQGRLSNGELWHIVAVGLPWDFSAPLPDETAVEICSRATKAGAFLAFAHPGWFAMTPEDVATLPMVHAVEVYNHGCDMGQMRGDGWYLADMALNSGRRLTAIANDDMHQLGTSFAGGWTMVKARELTPKAILAALHAGYFYSTQGPLIHNVAFKDGALLIDCSPVTSAAVVGTRGRCERAYLTGLATHLRIPVDKWQDGYFRVTLRDRHGRHAWTNPVWLD